MVEQLKKIKSICQHNKMLSKLTQHAQLIEKLSHTLHQVLPLQFSAHCRITNIKNQTLIIHTDNASFASLIRFQAPALCETFSAQLELTINNIEVKVRPSPSIPSQNDFSATPLPKSAATALHETATVIDNAPLSAALEKLASRFKN